MMFGWIKKLFKRDEKYLKIEGDPYVNIPSGVELRCAGDPGSSGQVLTSGGPGANPLWADPPSGQALTFEKYYDGTLAAGASYTPADSGLFMAVTTSPFRFDKSEVHWEVMVNGTWRRVGWRDEYGTLSENASPFALGDGSNLRLMNSNDSYSRDCAIYRMG